MIEPMLRAETAAPAGEVPPCAGGLPALLESLAQATAALPLARKLLVCRTPAQGRELLHALAAPGSRGSAGSRSRCASSRWTSRRPRSPREGGRRWRTSSTCSAWSDDALDAVGGARRRPRAAAAAPGFRDAAQRAVQPLRAAGVSRPDVGAGKRRGRREARRPRGGAGGLRGRLARGGPRGRPPACSRRAVGAAGGRRRRCSPDGRASPAPGAGGCRRAGRLLRGAARDGRGGSARRRRGAGPGRARGPALERRAGPPAPSPGCTPRSRRRRRPRRPESGCSPPPPRRTSCARCSAASLARGHRRGTEVEIVTTDAATYGPALDSLARRLGIPVTHAAGLPAAARAWDARWRLLPLDRRGLPRGRLRRLLESGDLAPPEGSARTSPRPRARAAAAAAGGLGAGALPGGGGARAARASTRAPAHDDASGTRRTTLEARERERRELRALRSHARAGPRRHPADPRPPARRASAAPRPAAVARGAARLPRLRAAGRQGGEHHAREICAAALAARSRDAHPRDGLGGGGRHPCARTWRCGSRPRRRRRGRLMDLAGGAVHLSDLRTGGLSCRPPHLRRGPRRRPRGALRGAADPLLARPRAAERGRGGRGRGRPAAPHHRPSAWRSRHALAACWRASAARSRSPTAPGTSPRDAPSPPRPSSCRRSGCARATRRSPTTTSASRMGPLACAVPARQRPPRRDRRLDAPRWPRRQRASATGGELVRSPLPGPRPRARRQRAPRGGRRAHGVPRPHRPGPGWTRAASGRWSSPPAGWRRWAACPRRFLYQYVLGVHPAGTPVGPGGVAGRPGARLPAARASTSHALRERGSGDRLRTTRAFEALALEVLRERGGDAARPRAPRPAERVLAAELEALRAGRARSFVRDDPRRRRPSGWSWSTRSAPGSARWRCEVGRARGAAARARSTAWTASAPTAAAHRGLQDGQRRPLPARRSPSPAAAASSTSSTASPPSGLLEGAPAAMEYHFPTRRGEKRGGALRRRRAGARRRRRWRRCFDLAVARPLRRHRRPPRLQVLRLRLRLPRPRPTTTAKVAAPPWPSGRSGWGRDAARVRAASHR